MSQTAESTGQHETDAQRRPFTIVVGVSPTSGSPYALTWAAAQAAAHDGRVIAVRAWKPAVATGARRPTAVPSAHDDATIETEVATGLAADVEKVLGPDHAVELRVVPGGRRKALTEASGEADLVVIDAARTGEVGSDSRLARRLVQTSLCPVVVMPPDVAGAPPSWLSRALASLGRNLLRAVGTSGRPGMSSEPMFHDPDA